MRERVGVALVVLGELPHWLLRSPRALVGATYILLFTIGMLLFLLASSLFH